MNIFAIGDLHLSFGTPRKEMDIFGPEWVDHHEKIKNFWDSHVKEEDLVLIPGDISWAKTLDEAQKDLDWIGARPGTKVLIRGNHDYWWQAISKVRKALPPSCHAIQNDAFLFKDIGISGTRLWDSREYSFSEFIDIKGPLEKEEIKEKYTQDDEKIFGRELLRLEASIKALPQNVRLRICMTHYPPIGAHLSDSQCSHLFESAHIDHVIFGHLHSLKKGQDLFGEKNGVSYHLVSCDYLNFTLLKVAEKQ
jgi:uncharacterized protein